MTTDEFEQGVEQGKRLPPGTVHLVDIEGKLVTKHADGKGESNIILVPRPSDDPEDPLNWTLRRKLLATSCVVMYTIMLAIPSSAVYSVVTPIRAATGLSLEDVNNGTGIMVRSDPRKKGKMTTPANRGGSSFSTVGAVSSGNLLLCNTASGLRTCSRWLLIS